MANRIQEAIERMAARLETVTADKRAKLDQDMQEDFSSLVAYQNAQAQAFASGRIGQAEAQALYLIYGGECPTADRWAKQPLAARIVATQAAGELLAGQIATRTRKGRRP